MSEMVERVARALQTSIFERLEPFGAKPPDDLTVAKRLARAAIAAMREPTPEMYDAVSNCGLMWRENDSVNVYRLMIDAALKEAADASA